jgi:hypothetical protein
VEPAAEGFAARLAAIHARLDHPAGVVLGVLRVHILDSILDELEALSEVPQDAVAELERLAELLTREMLGTSPEALQRRVRIVELLRRLSDGALTPLAADPADPFGAELRTMLESDPGLRLDLGKLHPLLARATSVSPSGRWVRAACDLVADADADGAARLTAATARVLAALVRADVESRPDLLIGGVRLANQRLARGLLWVAFVAFEAPAETLVRVGLRMGTSGRNDAVVRDTALANTCAALLGATEDPAAPAALASMRQEVTNRNVLKQVDRALGAQAARAGTSVDELVDASLSTFGLDERGQRLLTAGSATARITVEAEGSVAVRWLGAGGTESATPPAGVADGEPALVADVAAAAAAIEAAVAEERRRLEGRLGSVRSWPLTVWRRRFAEHPIAGPLGRRLVWRIDRPGPATSVVHVPGGWAGVDDRPVDMPEGARVGLWHPAEARGGEVSAWRATLTARAIHQPIRQVDREHFLPEAPAESSMADLRFVGHVVDHRRLRSLLRERGWAVPALGAWDQGDEATAWRAFDDGIRAELRYQAAERVRTADPVTRARIVGVRFVRTDAPPASPAIASSGIALADVPARVFSEGVRDVSLVVAVAELPADG